MKRSISAEELLRFSSARRRVLGEEHETVGVGGLGEKSMHKMLKLYIEPREEFHEVKYLGSVADVKNEEGIFEIQTRGVEKLAPRLKKYLAGDKVTVVIPLIVRKRISFIDPETGELSAPKLSPKHEGVYNALREIYKIRKQIKVDNLFFRLIYLNADEYKYLDGWDKTRKKGTTKIEKIPTAIVGEELISYRSLVDYVPFSREEEFTAKELCRAAAIPKRVAPYVVGLLSYAEAIVHVSKRGREYVYKKGEKIL